METVTLQLQIWGRLYPVDMPSVTTVGYAARRCAAAVGLDDDWPWQLTVPGAHQVLPASDIVAGLNQREVILVR
jgi:hypothetical protein